MMSQLIKHQCLQVFIDIKEPFHLFRRADNKVLQESAITHDSGRLQALVLRKSVSHVYK